jgi:cytidylate kinase
MSDLRDRLRQVRWIGGGSGGGKSTIARRLATEHDLHLYATDDVMTDHAARSTAADSPFLHRFMAMDMDERWLDRSPEVMLDTFHWFRGEGFDLIVDDLLALPADRGVVVEGFRLLPHLVQPLLSVPEHAVWLLPSPEFRLAAFDRRGSMWRIAGHTRDPQRALDNLLTRDRMFTDRMRAETLRLGLPVITPEATMTEGDLAARVGRAFGLAS